MGVLVIQKELKHKLRFLHQKFNLLDFSRLIHLLRLHYRNK